MARTTRLVPNMGLLWINHPHHRSTAARTSIAIDHISLLAFAGITCIDRCRRLLVTHDFHFADVEPDAAAYGATIDLGSFVYDLLHVRSAFRAAHRARPKGTGLSPADYDGVSLGGLFVAMPVEQQNNKHHYGENA